MGELSLDIGQLLPHPRDFHHRSVAALTLLPATIQRMVTPSASSSTY